MRNSIFNSLLLMVTLGLGFGLTGCGDNRLSEAHRQYLRGQYAAAIENYDGYIHVAQNGEKITRAEIERGDCYYKLGMRAEEVKNWELAARLFYLSNSPDADKELDNCYYILAQQAFDAIDYPLGHEYYRKVVDYLPDSELVPQIEYNEIVMAMQTERDTTTAWQFYTRLCDKYPDNEYVGKAQPFIDQFLPSYIDAAVALAESQSPQAAIDRLLELAKYPSSFHDTIYQKIGSTYMNMAEQEITATNYIEANHDFQLAIQYDPQQESTVKKRLNEICGLFIRKGDQLLAARKVDEAIANYRATFAVIPNYAPGMDGIDKAETLRRNIQMAEKLIGQAAGAESSKNYKLALDLYRQASQYDDRESTRKKIFEMTNKVMIENNPVGFARQVLREYHGGQILRRVQALQEKCEQTYGDDMQHSDWRFMLSVGDAKYEARYDITTPDKSYYLAWLLNLKDRTVTPLNKASEEISE